MKRNSLSLLCRRIIREGLFCGFALFSGFWACAQELLKNGDFDAAPLGPANWTVLYLEGGPDSWEMKDRATPSYVHNNGTGTGSFYDAILRPIDQKPVHACFVQTVTNLAPGHVYHLRGHMREDWWKSPDDALRDKYLVYIEVIGGLGTPTSDGRASIIATNDLTYATGHKYDPEPNIDPPYTYPTIIWRPFYADQTPDTNHIIEVRLHYRTLGWVEWDKCWLMAGHFDAVSLTP